jgi:peptidoglycan/xylan/chitin deacetylase (PgdA/CDA1 family)
MYVLDNVFARQMELLQQQFTIVSMQCLLDLWKKGQWDSQARYCAITFDDGWLDNYRYAYPILKRLNIPATVFLPTDYVGSHDWFWPDQLSALFEIIAERYDKAEQMNKIEVVLSRFLDVAVRPFIEAWRRQESVTDQIIERCKHLPIERIRRLIEALVKELGLSLPQNRVIVNWDEVREMSGNGISFGSHSCSHRILTTIAHEDVADELARSKQVLLAQGVNFVPVFCYPNGNTDPHIQSQVQACGYEAAVSVQMGVEGCKPENQFAVKRVGIHNDVTNTIPLFSLRLFGPMRSST